MGDMPPHVRWVGQYHLILAPRDSIFQVPPEEERRLIKEYRAALDGQHPQKSDNDYTTGDVPLSFERFRFNPRSTTAWRTRIVDTPLRSQS
jgi:hypothetical protein